MTELLFSCELSLTDWGVGSSYRSQSDSTKLLLNKYSRAEGVFNIQGKKCSELGNRLICEICEYEPHTHSMGVHSPSSLRRLLLFLSRLVKSTVLVILYEQGLITGPSEKTHRRLIYGLFCKPRQFLIDTGYCFLNHSHIDTLITKIQKDGKQNAEEERKRESANQSVDEK